MSKWSDCSSSSKGKTHRLELPFSEVGNGIDDNPGYSTAKVHDLRVKDIQPTRSFEGRGWRGAYLVHNEAHEAGRDHGVCYPEVPVDPPLLDGREGRVVDARAGVELCGCRLDRFWRYECRVEGHCF